MTDLVQRARELADTDGRLAAVAQYVTDTSSALLALVEELEKLRADARHLAERDEAKAAPVPSSEVVRFINELRENPDAVVEVNSRARGGLFTHARFDATDLAEELGGLTGEKSD